MRQVVADSIAPRRFQAALMGMFAAFALILAAVGIYGVVSYWVTQRTHEIGIRMALGATRLEVLADVLRQAGWLTLAGGAIGLGAAFALTPLLHSLLYGVGPGDPLVYAASGVVLLAVAAAASLGPARRATRLDPMICLRCE